MRKRKVTYPPARTATKQARDGAGSETMMERPTLVTINTDAANGRKGLSVGDRVTIARQGLYGGEAAVIEKLAGGAIPSALVRTEAGRSVRVRTIDLEPIVSPSA